MPLWRGWPLCRRLHEGIKAMTKKGKNCVRARRLLPARDQLLIASVVLAVSTAVMGQGTGGVLSLDQAVKTALASDPRLVALGYTREAMEEKVIQANGLPNPMLTYRGMDIPEAGRFPNTGEKRYEIEQPLPGFGKRALREAVSRNEADSMVLEADARAREIAFRVKEAAYEWQALQKILQINAEEERLLARMIEVTKGRYATGEAAQVDVVKAQTELTMLRQKEVDLTGRGQTLRAKLASLMNRDAGNLPASIQAPVPEGPVPESAAQVKRALEKRPEMSSARLKIERGELQRRLMAREVQPDYRVGLEYRSIDGGDDMLMFMAGVELPLWRSKNRAAVREAAMMVSASEADRDAVAREVTLEVQSACYKIDAAKRMLELYRKELMPQADVRLQSSEAGYSTGKVDFNDWLESERFRLTVRTMTVMAEADLGTGWASLERAVGGAL